jgi:hypothetical protein
VEEKIKNLKHLTQGQLATNNMLSLPHLSTKNMNDKLGTIMDYSTSHVVTSKKY